MKAGSWSRRAAWGLAAGALAAGAYLFWLAPSALRSSAGGAAAAPTLRERVELLFHDSAERHVALARSAEASGDIPEAVRQLQRALELEPGVPMLTQLGHLYARSGMYAEAAASYDQALVIEPDDGALLEWTLLANHHLGRRERMRELLEHQLSLDPSDALLHERLAIVMRQLDDPKAAVEHQREAIRLGSKQADLRNDVAWTLATSPDAEIRDPEEAIRLAQELIDEGTTRDPNEIDTLAAAYAAAGRFDEAVATATQAASLASERGETKLAATIRARVELYRTQRPYMESAASNGT